KFGTGEISRKRKVEPTLVIDATNNFELLKRDVQKLASSNNDDEKPMWEEIEARLKEINVEDLG
ncbi:10602_t:CDS:2, partial [Cetraspora pellucida]